nr:gibberellin 2-beta-dioxygenase 8-like [Tanacetum cinerariifolium]
MVITSKANNIPIGYDHSSHASGQQLTKTKSVDGLLSFRPLCDSMGCFKLVFFDDVVLEMITKHIFFQEGPCDGVTIGFVGLILTMRFQVFFFGCSLFVGGGGGTAVMPDIAFIVKFQLLPMDESDPPFFEFYKNLFEKEETSKKNFIGVLDDVEEWDLPVIDLSRLCGEGWESAKCKKEIAEASQKYGFFQVINHGVSYDILEKMRCEQMKVFKNTFHAKAKNQCESNFPIGSYRWGTPSATCLRQLAWSEAFHVPLTDISNMSGLTSLRLNLSSLNQWTVLRIDHSILAVELQPRSRPSGNSLW